MTSIFDSHIMGRYGLICTPDTDHSEILYVVIVKLRGVSAIFDCNRQITATNGKDELERLQLR